VPTTALHAFVAEHMPAVVGLTSSQAGDAPQLAAAIVAIHHAYPAVQIMLGGSGVPVEWRQTPYPWVLDATTALDTVEHLLGRPPQKLPLAIRQIHSNMIETLPSLPMSASAADDERLAAALTDTGKVSRRYARLAAEYRYLAYRDPLTALPTAAPSMTA